MKMSRVLIISILTIVMPLSQARAVVPDSIVSDVIEATTANDVHISGTDAQHINVAPGVIHPSQDLPKITHITPADIIKETPTPSVEELETQGQEEQDEDRELAGAGFWTGKKIFITASTVLLTTGLVLGLVLLLAGSGGGSGSGSGSGEGGGGGNGGGGNTGDSSLPDGGSNPSNPSLGGDNPGIGNQDPSANGDNPGTGDNNPGADQNPSAGGDNPPPGSNPPNGNEGPSGDNPTGNNPDGSGFPPIGGGGIPGGDPGDLPIDPILPSGPTIPHHPEPSTVLLLGLGLLVPFLRKRSL